MADATAIRRVAIVMAGGSGERFWPLSRVNRPKQLLCLASEHETMLAQAVSRLAQQIDPRDIYVATGRHLVDPIRAARVGVPDENVIAEPCKRNTAGCLVYAVAHLLAKYGGAHEAMDSRDLWDRISMAIVTADPLIGDVEAFRRTLDVASDTAENERALVTIGIVPTRPETGYGYVQIPEDRQPLPRYAQQPCVFPVTRFHEKPSREVAEEFLATGRFFWNSGMFFWRVSTFLEELEIARSDLFEATLAMARAMRAGDPEQVTQRFEAIENVSIDFALMERARRVLVVEATFPWDDVGTWTALDRTYPHDARGNVAVGNPVLVDCEDCIVYNDTPAAGKDIAVAVVGVEHLVVVATEDAVLVIAKDRAQDVKQAIEALKRRNAPQV